MILTIIGAVLSILAALLPTILTALADHSKERKAAADALQRNNRAGLDALERRVRELQSGAAVRRE